MRTLTRYMLREMVVPFLIGQAAIVLMLTGSVLYNNANLFVQFEVPAASVARLALFFIPFLIHMTMPVAMAVAASLAVSRLSRDSEITVMRAAGVSLMRIFLPIFLTGLVVSAGDFLFGEWVVPATVQRFITVEEQLTENFKNLTPPAGQTVALDGHTVVGVRTMLRRRGYIELHGISINSSQQLLSGSTRLLSMARDGTYRSGVWTLFNAEVISYDPLHPDTVNMVHMNKVSYHIAVDPQFFQNGFQLQMPMGQMAGSATITYRKLGEMLKQDRRLRIYDPSRLLDYYFKLSVPFSCLVMALCCPPLALKYGRGGGFMGTLLSIMLVFVYWNTLLLSRILGSPGAGGAAPLLPPIAAAWSQNVLFSLAGLWMLHKSE